MLAAFSAFSTRRVVLYGTFWVAWKRGCIEFELASLAIAGIDASRTGKLAWVEVDVLTTLSLRR
jgi:hypothetical protein